MSSQYTCCTIVKNASRITSALRIYPILIDIVRVKRSLVVKARDARIYLGIRDHSIITSLGILLSLLSKLGYATRVNGSRPLKYALNPIFIELTEICSISRGDEYCSETGCSYLGICPYWRLKELVG